MRVRVPQPSKDEATPQPWDPSEDEASLDASIWKLAGAASVELLCTSRGLLKKMKQKVFVGDLVSLTNIDWTSSQGKHAGLFLSLWSTSVVLPMEECDSSQVSSVPLETC